MKSIDIELSSSETEGLILKNPTSKTIISVKNNNRYNRVNLCCFNLCCFIPSLIIIVSFLSLIACGTVLLDHYDSKKHGVHETNFTYNNNYKISSENNKKYIILCESKSKLYGNCYFDCKCYKTTSYNDALNFGENYCKTNTTINGYIYKTQNNDKICVLDNPNKKIHNVLYTSRIYLALLIIGIFVLTTYQITKYYY